MKWDFFSLLFKNGSLGHHSCKQCKFYVLLHHFKCPQKGPFYIFVRKLNFYAWVSPSSKIDIYCPLCMTFLCMCILQKMSRLFFGPGTVLLSHSPTLLQQLDYGTHCLCNTIWMHCYQDSCWRKKDFGYYFIFVFVRLMAHDYF